MFLGLNLYVLVLVAFSEAFVVSCQLEALAAHYFAKNLAS